MFLFDKYLMVLMSVALTNSLIADTDKSVKTLKQPSLKELMGKPWTTLSVSLYHYPGCTKIEEIMVCTITQKEGEISLALSAETEDHKLVKHRDKVISKEQKNQLLVVIAQYYQLARALDSQGEQLKKIKTIEEYNALKKEFDKGGGHIGGIPFLSIFVKVSIGEESYNYDDEFKLLEGFRLAHEVKKLKSAWK